MAIAYYVAVIRRIQVASDLAADPDFSNTPQRTKFGLLIPLLSAARKLGSSLQMRSSALASSDLTLMFLNCMEHSRVEAA
jgi:hypothetical protein